MDVPYFVLSDYIQHAMEKAFFETLEDGSWAGKIDLCQGVIAFGKTEAVCRGRLQATLESWLLLRLKLGHALPVIHGINLNQEI